jgi:hypothetical protein
LSKRPLPLLAEDEGGSVVAVVGVEEEGSTVVVAHAPSPGRQSVGPVQALPRLAVSVSTV